VDTSSSAAPLVASIPVSPEPTLVAVSPEVTISTEVPASIPAFPDTLAIQSELPVTSDPEPPAVTVETVTVQPTMVDESVSGADVESAHAIEDEPENPEEETEQDEETLEPTVDDNLDNLSAQISDLNLANILGQLPEAGHLAREVEEGSDEDLLADVSNVNLDELLANLRAYPQRASSRADSSDQATEEQDDNEDQSSSAVEADDSRAEYGSDSYESDEETNHDDHSADIEQDSDDDDSSDEHEDPEPVQEQGTVSNAAIANMIDELNALDF
jgi:hypothetical protein